MTTAGNDKRRLLKAILKKDQDQVKNILDGMKAPAKVRNIYIGFTEEEEAELRRRDELETEVIDENQLPYRMKINRRETNDNELPGNIEVKYRDEKPEHGGYQIRFIDTDELDVNK